MVYQQFLRCAGSLLSWTYLGYVPCRPSGGNEHLPYVHIESVNRAASFYRRLKGHVGVLHVYKSTERKQENKTHVHMDKANRQRESLGWIGYRYKWANRAKYESAKL